MKEETKQSLRTFFNADTWHKKQSHDENRFLDFIITAFKNSDFNIHIDDFKKECVDDLQKNKKLETTVENLYYGYVDGVYLLKKFTSEN